MRIKDKTIFKWKQAKTYEYCLGIDLALRRSGVALLRKDYEFIMSDYFDTTHSVDNLINLSEEVTTKFISILEPYKEELKDCCVVIEHAAVNWKFTLMLGMVTNILTNYFQVKEIRAISANRWQTDLLRKQRYWKKTQIKELSRDYFNEIETKNKKERMVQDEYDAYGIATWGINKLFNSEENDFEIVNEEEQQDN